MYDNDKYKTLICLFKWHCYALRFLSFFIVTIILEYYHYKLIFVCYLSKSSIINSCTIFLESEMLVCKLF